MIFHIWNKRRKRQHRLKSNDIKIHRWKKKNSVNFGTETFFSGGRKISKFIDLAFCVYQQRVLAVKDLSVLLDE